MDAVRVHILVVDDLIDMAESTAEVLTLWGYDATTCDSGVAALAYARLRRLDAVLLDLAMPRMDGFQFARAFRELSACGTVPLIAISGYSTPEYKARAWAVGIEHYLPKPVKLDQLKTLLASLTGSGSHQSVRSKTVGPVGVSFASSSGFRGHRPLWRENLRSDLSHYSARQIGSAM